jgi:endonuclease III
MGRHPIQASVKKKRKSISSRSSSGRAAAKAKTPGKPKAKRAAPKARATDNAQSPKPWSPRPWTAAEVEEAFRRFAAAIPEPRGELEHINPYTLLVAVVLSAQATDAGVNKATKPLFAVVDTPQKMVALGEERLRDYIKTIGLYNTKAKNVIALSQKLIDEHNGEVPAARAVLETLPGVGRKTANVVLNIAFGEETFAVDTHVFRVGNRTGMAPGKTPLEVELKLEKTVPPPYRVHAHHWLILHGRYVCKAQRPLCETCVINDLCRWPQKTTFMASA